MTLEVFLLKLPIQLKKMSSHGLLFSIIPPLTHAI
uniref:Uncharacterized protein n=1 Tax=Cucumis melo TaxID=3656 RepID=A0A9I9E6H1_CUCME